MVELKAIKKIEDYSSLLIDDGIEDINPYFNQNYTIENNVFFKGYGIESFLRFFQDCNLIFESKKSTQVLLKK